MAVRLPGRGGLPASLRPFPESVLGPLRQALGAIGAPTTRRRRRVWSNGQRAHIEVKGVRRLDGQGVARAVEDALQAVAGVEWARVNAPLGRVVVAFDSTHGSARALVAVVEAVEEEHGSATEGFPAAADHPADAAPLRRHGIALAADAAGLGLAVVGRLLPVSPLAPELLSVTSMVDNLPRLRAGLGRAFGPAVTDSGLALVNAIAQGLAQGPTGLLLDAAHRALGVAEASATYRNWQAREPELAGDPERAGAAVLAAERPRPIRPGPSEAYADRATLGAVGGLSLALLATGNPRRASSLALAAVPKAARLGPEAFAAQLGRSLAQRGVVVMEPGALRRLDRVDAVVVDTGALPTGQPDLERLGPLAGACPADRSEAMAAFYGMFDPGRPRRQQSSRGWWLGPPGDLPGRTATTLRAARRAAEPGRTVLALARDGHPVALAVVGPRPHPGMDGLIAAVRRSEATLVAAGEADGSLPTPADRVVNGRQLVAVVRSLQAEGRVVAVLSSTAAALAAADIGIGTCRGEACPPWGAHLLVEDDLAAATLVVDAVGVARAVRRRSLSLALGGSSIGAAMAITSSPARAPNRALLAVNAAAGTSLAWGAWSARELASRPQSPPVDRTPWHAMPTGAVLGRLRSSANGLTGAEADRRRRARRGPEPAPVTFAHAFLQELANPFTPVLAVGAGLSAAVGSVTDAAIVAGVSAASALTGGVQRLATERAVAGLLAQAATPARVLRDGDELPTSADELVPGDVVRLAAGDGVPADCRLLEADGLEVDESSLTGESLPVPKEPTPVPAEDLAERTSMAYEGTVVAAGSARAVVVATGVSTEAGRALALNRAGTRPVGVEARLARLTRVSVPVALGAGAGVVLAGLARGRSPAQTLGAGVALTVAAVPEGLPFLVTAAQLAAARRLSTRRALVKNPRTIEALGRADVLCFDKTGTLTEGRIRLRMVSDGIRSQGLGTLDAAARDVVAAALRATPAAVGGPELAHPTDQGVTDGAAEAGLARTRGCRGWRSISELPFEPARRYHATLGRSGRRFVLSVKGAPEVVVPRCSSWRSASGTRRLEGASLSQLGATLDDLAGRGLRVLAVAEGESDAATRAWGSGEAPIDDGAVQGLCFLGFLALADRARATAAEAVGRLRAAGVQLVMITGDHPSTAEAVAADLGLLNGGQVLTGADLEEMSDEELERVLPEVSVFARVTPAHKVAIVGAFQRAGRAVAMTGDGANDAAAIRLADVGVALGRRGTSAAREAADVVVADDRLESIVEALAEGRAMWGSVRDALSILLGGNLGEIAFTLVGAAVSGRSPLNARQLLLVNLLTDLAPAMALAVRAPASSTEALLAEGPDRSLGLSLDRDIAVRAAATGCGASAAWVAARLTGRRARADTVGLVALVGTQLGQTLFLGRRRPAVALTAVGSAAVLAGIVQTPGLSHFFGCTPLGPVAWVTALGCAGAATTGSAILPALARGLPRGAEV